MRRTALAPIGLLLLSGLASAAPEDKPDSRHHEKHLLLNWGGARLGVDALEISKEVREILGAPADAGVLVNRVEPKSTALEAGIKPGDVIVEIDGQKVAEVGDIRESLADKEAGDKATVAVIRGKNRQTLTATIKEKMPSMARIRFPDDRLWTEEFGPGLRKQLEKLQERVADLEKKLQNFNPGR
jgi:membrane-associated protease RseP (regulator of RpoE activity)